MSLNIFTGNLQIMIPFSLSYCIYVVCEYIFISIIFIFIMIV